MRKVFCDKCSREITKQNDAKKLEYLTIQFARNNSTKREKFTLRPAVDQADDDFAHDICKHCVIDAVNRLDDRQDEPMPAAPSADAVNQPGDQQDPQCGDEVYIIA